MTQSSKRKEKRNKDVSDTNSTADTNIDTDTDTINDNNTSNQKVTWNEHGLQSTYGDMNGLQQINYGDDDHKIDISNRIVLGNKTYRYKSYKDACNGNIITHRSNTITHGTTPTTPPITSE